jgi:formylglycine-generating enzyme required for sulfatase activity
MGKCEVTQAEYTAVTGDNPSLYTEGPDYPVERVSWHEAVSYCRQLTRLHRETDRIPPDYAYRLPTEAEWEYACRAGSDSRFSHGDDEGYRELGDYAWYAANSQSAPHPIGQKKPNPWGFHDFHGNVWEWCSDDWTGQYPGGSLTNRVADSQDGLKVARGGSWLYAGRHCRSANRDNYGPANRCSDVGFRIVLAPVSPRSIDGSADVSAATTQR